jgi:hypothetical protein
MSLDDRERWIVAVFDNSVGSWCIVRSDGTIVMDGFATNVAAWRWIDAQSEADQADAATVDRIREAFSTR